MASDVADSREEVAGVCGCLNCETENWVEEVHRGSKPLDSLKNQASYRSD